MADRLIVPVPQAHTAPSALRFGEKREALLYALDKLAHRPGLELVEIGAMRGEPGSFAALVDGASTLTLAKAASEEGWHMTTIEADRETAMRCQAILHAQGLDAWVRVIVGDGERALKRPGLQPDFLLMDGDDDPEQALQQLKAVAQWPSVVVVDDCCANGFSDALALGKGSRVVPYLAERGWAYELVETWFNTMAILTRSNQ